MSLSHQASFDFQDLDLYFNLKGDQALKEASGCCDLERRIAILREKINEHRQEKEGKCWYFGINGLEFDYGESWDSADYWALLVSFTGGEGLGGFAYRKMEGICQDCNKATEEINDAWETWLKLKNVPLQE